MQVYPLLMIIATCHKWMTISSRNYQGLRWINGNIQTFLKETNLRQDWPQLGRDHLNHRLPILWLPDPNYLVLLTIPIYTPERLLIIQPLKKQKTEIFWVARTLKGQVFMFQLKIWVLEEVRHQMDPGDTRGQLNLVGTKMMIKMRHLRLIRKLNLMILSCEYKQWMSQILTIRIQKFKLSSI